MAEMDRISIKKLRNEVERLRKEEESVSRKIKEISDQIRYHNTMVYELCKKRDPFDEEYNKLYKKLDIAEQALELVTKLGGAKDG